METDDRLSKKPNSFFPVEIVQEILSRLQVKSILRFRSVSTRWLSYISDPSFTKQQLTRATSDHRHALFISAYDTHTRKRHFLSAALDGGPVTHLMSFDHAFNSPARSEHLNGLVCFSFVKNFSHNDAFVFNPSTHKFCKLPDPDGLDKVQTCYAFGFDESRNEHKILMIRALVESDTVDAMIFSLSDNSWRKIDHLEPPVGFSWESLSCETDSSVCVNSVMHLMLSEDSFDILGFDLRTYKFSVISTPEAARPLSYLMKIDGCLGVVSDYGLEDHELHIWILQDYENRVWVREIIRYPKDTWVRIDNPNPLDSLNQDEIIFTSSTLYKKGHIISVYVYNRKEKRFRALEFTLGHQFPCPVSVSFKQISCYLETLLPLSIMEQNKT